MYDLANLFHIGILTPDINESMQELSRTMGVTWASMIDEMRVAWVPGTGRVEIPCKITYSVEGPVHLELIEGGAGSIWDGVASPGAHHFGVWSEDIVGEVERLQSAGWTLEVAGLAPDQGYGTFAYMRSPQGFLIEPVRATAKPRFERWWAGGALRDPVQSS